jgi:hypothetical protein
LGEENQKDDSRLILTAAMGERSNDPAAYFSGNLPVDRDGRAEEMFPISLKPFDA